MNARVGDLPGEVLWESRGDPRRWFSLPVLLVGALLPVLDFNAVNLALPAIQKTLGATSSQVQFVISAYAATYAVFLITGGRLGDWFGRKPMFLLGVAGFTLASVLCGTAQTSGVLIGSRILQALTATGMAPQVLASIRVLFAPHEQGRAVGLYGATFGLANILGQVVGGFLVAAQPFGFSWQAIFLINVPIGLAAFVGGLLFLGDSRADHTQKLDLSGVVWLSVTLILLVYPLVEGRELQWPLWIVAMLICSPLSFLAFVQVERRVAERGGAPLVDMSLFRAPGFAIGVGMALVFYTLSAFYLTFSIYLQGGLHLSPLAAGLQTLPLGVGYFLASFASAPLMRWLGPRALIAGFVVQVLGFAAVILAVSGLWDGGCSAGLAVAGAGFGVVMTSVIKAVVGGVDPRHAGLASGVVMSTFQVGSALGVAVIGGVFFSTLGDGRDLAAHAQAFAKALSCNIALLAFGGLLSFWLPDERPRF